MNKLTVPSKTNLANRQQAAQLSLAAMQADMGAALKNKQQDNIAQKSNLKPAASNDKSPSVTADNELDAVQLSRVIEMA